MLALTSARVRHHRPDRGRSGTSQSGDVVINCAAYTNVDEAEADEAAGDAVNAVGPENIAHACARAGAELIHISTDYVFGGDFGGSAAAVRDRRRDRPAERLRPLQARGRTAVLAAMPEAHVVRTAWIFSGGDGRISSPKMRRLAAGDGAVDVVADQVGSPTYVGDLVEALLQVADGAIEEPVLHAANEGEASRFEQARAVFEVVGADPSGSDRWAATDIPAPRRARCIRRCPGGGRQAAGLTPLRPWRDALAAALRAPLDA